MGKGDYKDYPVNAVINKYAIINFNFQSINYGSIKKTIYWIPTG